jgi:exopolyphosphatase/guanosine-5'-triphosphate,3'-diphosphate pyrophosphatase
MRLAVIDLGTNTFNLLIVDFNEQGMFSPVFNTKKAVKIGEGAMIKNMLQPEPMARGMATLSEYVQIIDEHNCERTVAFATSGIRSTQNGAAFVSKVRSQLGLEINIIDGDEEAQLIYEGVDLAVKFEETPMVVMDIGGGSTEFIIANSSGVLWKKSYMLGISRILQMLEPQDPLVQADFSNLNELFDDRLQELIEQCKLHRVKTMVGSSGSFDSFIEMLWAEDGITRDASSVVTEEFNLERVLQLHNKLTSLDFDKRKEIPGLVLMRVESIHLASYMVQWVMKNCGLERLLLSSYALKEGVLHRALENRI